MLCTHLILTGAYLINANTIKNEKELRRDFNIELELIYSKDIELPEFNKRVQYFMINFKLDEIDFFLDQ